MQKLLILTFILLIGILVTQCKAKIKKPLIIGDTIPDFSLLDQNGAVFNLSDAKGQALVIYFYPKDDTPGCTKEACRFRDEFEVFSDLDARVIGVSSDDVASHKEFEIKYNLPFTLLADTDQKLRKLFGVPSFGAGLVPGRVTYIIDKKAVVRYVFSSMRQAEMHVDKSLEILKTIK
jgi:peroxiredoxin Q/BCP